MTSKELNEKRLKAIADARAILDATGDKGLDAETAAKYDAFMVDAKRHKDQLDRMTAVEAEEASIAEERNVAPPVVRQKAQAERPTPTGPMSEEQRTRHAIAQPEYKELFWKAVRNGLGELDPAERRSLTVGTDTAGGYLVPDEYERTLIQGLNEPVIMRGLATVISGVSGDKTIPIVSAHGAAGWTAEEVTASESDETFASKKFSAYKLTRIIKASIELVNDNAFDLESYIRNEYIRAFSAAEDTAFIAGTGVGRPKGFTLDGTATTAAASATTVTADELLTLKHAIGRAYRAKARWFMADGSVLKISKLKDGDGQYLWRPGLTEGAPDVLFGNPVEVSSDMPAMATGLRAVYYGDPSYYYIVDRAGIYFQVLKELYAVNGQIAFLAYKRTDGALILNAAMYYIAMA